MLSEISLVRKTFNLFLLQFLYLAFFKEKNAYFILGCYGVSYIKIHEKNFSCQKDIWYTITCSRIIGLPFNTLFSQHCMKITYIGLFLLLLVKRKLAL